MKLRNKRSCSGESSQPAKKSKCGNVGAGETSQAPKESKRRTTRCTGETRQPPKKSKRATGYSLFLSDYMKKEQSIAEGKFVMVKVTKDAATEWKELSEEKKLEYKKKAKECNGDEPRKGKKKGKKTKVKPIFKTRCSPGYLVKVNDALSESQKGAVTRLGFGALLEMQDQTLQRDFIAKLLKHFNPETRSLQFGRYKSYEITPGLVATALGLEIGTIPVPKVFDETHETKLKELFKLEGKELEGGGMSFQLLQKKIEDQKGQVGETFLKGYLLLALACFLCPTTKDQAAKLLYPAIFEVDLEKCNQYQWPEFILDWLVTQLKYYKKRQAIRTCKSSPGIGGCVHLLMLIYFHLEPLGVGLEENASPLIQFWTPMLVKKRMLKEENLELFDPASEKFPQPRLQQPILIRAYHEFKMAVINIMEVVARVDAAMTEAQSNVPGQRDMPSTSTSKSLRTAEMARPAIDQDVEDESDAEKMCGLRASQRPLSVSVDIQTGVDDTGGSASIGEGDKREDVDDRGEFVFTTPVDIATNEIQVMRCGSVPIGEGGDEEVHAAEEKNKGKGDVGPAIKKYFSKRPLKKGRAIRSPYVANALVKPASHFTKEETKLLDYYIKKEPSDSDAVTIIVKFEKFDWGSTWGEIYDVFKPRAHMSNMVLRNIVIWLMKLEVFEAQKKRDSVVPAVHMFSPIFVTNLMNKANFPPSCDIWPENTHADYVGYELLYCDMLFFPVLLRNPEHWFCVAISLVDKRIDILDSMALEVPEKAKVIEDVVGSFYDVMKSTKDMENMDFRAWPKVEQEVPKQPNTFDCGFYMVKFMEHWRGRLTSQELEGLSSKDLRRRLLLRLLLSPYNLMKDEIRPGR